ncbi:MAG: dihydroorotate dehydrogenase electron transfer subunit [Planctomycetes bacterium]|nr:dihydroorotate dehydrogenase electron transfer subunit [Planctomycetota bacterium]
MENATKNTDKTISTAKVRSNLPLGPCFYRLSLDLDEVGCRAFSGINPGRFVELRLSELAIPHSESIPDELADAAQRKIILSRPFSLCDVKETDGKVSIDILFKVLGAATVRMTTLKPGDELTIIGPLGNGFKIDETKTNALLVAGGLGAPPLQHLADHIKVNYPHMRVVAFAGAQTYDQLPFTVLIDNEEGLFLEEFSRMRVESHIATDDGSAGLKGFVTQRLAQWIEEHQPDTSDSIIYSCGPEPMLASVAKLAGEHDIDCQVSMESMMACGIGLCQSCVVKANTGSDETSYKLCCLDGPVFDSKDIDFG